MGASTDSGIPSYPKIVNHFHQLSGNIPAGTACHVQEKLDGSQFSVRRNIDNTLSFRSRGAVVHEGDAGMFGKAVTAMNDRRHSLKPEVIYRGEYVSKLKHNSMTYERVPDGYVAVFEVQDPNGVRLPMGEAKECALMAGLEFVECDSVKYAGLASVQEFVDKVSMLGGTREGVVVKPVEPIFNPIDAKELYVKVVTEAFREKHSREWKVTNPKKSDIIQLLIEELRNEKRWEKGVQHLAERGEFVGGPQMIGPLLKEIKEDIRVEEESYIKQRLFDAFVDDILRGSVKGVPEWTKEFLAKQVSA